MLGQSAPRNAAVEQSIACIVIHKKPEWLVKRARIETNIASKKSVTKMNVYYQTFAKDVGKSPNLAVPSAAAERRPEHFS